VMNKSVFRLHRHGRCKYSEEKNEFFEIFDCFFALVCADLFSNIRPCFHELAPLF